MKFENKSLIVTYDVKNALYIYSDAFKNVFSIADEKKTLSENFISGGASSDDDAVTIKSHIDFLLKAENIQSSSQEFLLHTNSDAWNWFRFTAIYDPTDFKIQIVFNNIDQEISKNEKITYQAKYDSVTGLFKRDSFIHVVDVVLKKDKAEVEAGNYSIVFFDINRFKAINEIFGFEGGNLLLSHIADVINRLIRGNGLACRLSADCFALFVHKRRDEIEGFIQMLIEMCKIYNGTYKISMNLGICSSGADVTEAPVMLDRAILAQKQIKGNFARPFNFYTDDLRDKMLTENNIVSNMQSAVDNEEFKVYFQPQYNHSTGMLLGAEALVRWEHPGKGLVPPNDFIPIFEQNGLITSLDYYVFDHVCQFLKKCYENKWTVVHISVNFSRYDIFQPDFVEKLEEIRKKYGVDVKHVRIEITESVTIGGTEQINEIVGKLHKAGYIVEMDDFGSGYSSLNVLKDIDFDVVKLDMKFLQKAQDSGRGGTILSSVARMTRWLNIPVIAEGVETVEQADYLRSIGIDAIQGYLYSRPLSQENYEKLLSDSKVGAVVPKLKIVDNLNSRKFWDPQTIDTIIFSEFIGAAGIIEYCQHPGSLEILRVNQKFLKELGMNLSEENLVNPKLPGTITDDERQVFYETVQKAIATEEECECDVWLTVISECCGNEDMCIRVNMRVIGKSNNEILFFFTIRNLTGEKSEARSIKDVERRFMAASEQANIYFWEYDVLSKEMKPCFRCQRDLGLPPLVRNYPEPVIESGLFPADYAAMYRDWHKAIEEGVEHLEAIIPLTKDRIPFHVRYTTEFDENHHPVKAYGSATKVVD